MNTTIAKSSNPLGGYKSFSLSHQSGAALVVSLILLLVLTVLGLSAMQRSVMQERMATNMHVSNVTFSAAESAIGAFIAEANTGNKLDSNHVLFKLRVSGSIVDKSYDKTGARVNNDFINVGRDLRATVQPSIVKECDLACEGFSLGLSSSSSQIRCRNYLITGRGDLVSGGSTIKSTSTSLWAKEITLCK